MNTHHSEVLIYYDLYNHVLIIGNLGHSLYINNNPINIFVHATLCTFGNISVGWIPRAECHKLKIQALLVAELIKKKTQTQF